MAKKPASVKTVRWGRFELTEAEITRQITEATRRGAEELLTFDANQRKLATAEGLKVKP